MSETVKLINYKNIGLTTLLVLFLVLLMFIPPNLPTIKVFLQKYDLWISHPPFTELYFVNPGQISNQVSDFAFTIKNLEGIDYIYEYEVFYISPDSDEEVLIKEDNVELKKDTEMTIPFDIDIQSLQPNTRIFVNLKNKNQQIYFRYQGQI